MAYVIFVGLAVILGIQIGARVVEEANTLAKKAPGIVTQWNQQTPGATAVNWIKQQVGGEVNKWSENLLTAVPQAGIKVLAAASNLIFVIIIPLLAFFFLKDGEGFRLHILELVDPGPRRALLDDVLADTHRLLAHYMRALLGLGATVLTAYGIFFAVAGVPYGLLLAALGAMLEIIPMIGPATGGILIVLLTAVTGGHVMAVVVFLVIFRIVQDYVISPHLMGKGVELHPLVVIFGVFAGAQVAGVAGSFLSVPILAFARVIYVRIRQTRIDARVVLTRELRP